MKSEPFSCARPHPKIADEHLARLAYIYVRQSSQKQVMQNKESQVNQYLLVERAEQLGWQAERVHVIDTDLGLSGKESASRNGFQELVAEVSLGHVGIVFGYEVSRLARNNSDWYHLLDLAAVFNTLIADHDGVYDPRLYNDRLLLGLKGTMSEAELHLLKMRMEEGRLRQIERGELRQVLPTGLERLPNNKVVKDPDDQVRHTLELVFRKFEELGSCRKVLAYLRENKVVLPRRQTYGPHLSEIVWKSASQAAILSILHNPAYAGAFVFGKTYRDPRRIKPGRKDTGVVRRPLEDWQHIHQGIYPAYISWEQFLKNQEQLHENTVRFDNNSPKAGGPCRRGSGLLQGLAICGDCGYHMMVEYNPFPRYSCREMGRRLDVKACKSLPGSVIDPLVVEQFMAAIQPAQLDALEALLLEQQTERNGLIQNWEERLKRTRYDARLAEHQYKAVDPDNRLVAAELERRWEEKLRQLQETQEAYERFRQTPPISVIPTELREQFRAISTSLPELWHNDQITVEEKKKLLRSLVSHVILTRKPANSIEIKIVWVSGHYTIVEGHPPVYRTSDLHDLQGITERIHELWLLKKTDQEIATLLSQEGFRSPRSLQVNPSTVQRIRFQNNWKTQAAKVAPRLQLAGFLSATDLAEYFGVNRSWILRRIYNKTIPPSDIVHHPVFRTAYMVRMSAELIERLKQDLAKGQHDYERI
jgi:DNA invertase Pin-like site-specific DNA recombinase